MKRMMLISVLFTAAVISFPALPQTQACGVDPVGECKDGCVQAYEIAYDACSEDYSGDKSAQRQCYEREFETLLRCNKACEQVLGGGVADNRLRMLIRPTDSILTGSLAAQGA